LDPADQEPQPQPSIDVQESVEMSMAGGAECSVAPSAAPSDDGSNKSRSNSKDSQVEAVTGLVVRSNSADNFDKDGDEEFSPDGGAENVETHSVGSQLSRIQSRASLKKAGLFSDDKGNLRFVNLVVRNPCLFLFFFKFGGAQSLHVFFWNLDYCLGVIVFIGEQCHSFRPATRKNTTPQLRGVSSAIPTFATPCCKCALTAATKHILVYTRMSSNVLTSAPTR
jgi:hypothetical protein